MINSFHHKVFNRFKEPISEQIQLIQRRNCHSNQTIVNNKNDKFKQLINEGPSLGDFIRSSSVQTLKLKRDDDEPR